MAWADPTLAPVSWPRKDAPTKESAKFLKVLAWTAVVGFTLVVFVLGGAAIVALF